MQTPVQTSSAGSLDPQAVMLAKAIRQTESGGNFTAQGKSGEYGAYQYTEPTWQKDAMAAGVNVPLKQATPEQQNQVAYTTVKKWKDAGYNPGQIASMWNAGEGKPDAYLQGNAGVNKYGVKYDTAAYAKSVAMAYQTLKQGGQVQVDPNNPSSVAPATGYNPKPYSNPGQIDYSGSPTTPPAAVTSSPDANTLGGQLAHRIDDASSAVTEAGGGVSKILQGNFGGIKDVASGALQTVGAAAGGIGDIVNKGLEFIPGVKQVENLIGQGAGALLSTPGGKSVAKSIQDFSTQHPELSKDIGAGFNIITAIPILRGLGVVKNVALDGVSQALKGVAEKSAQNGLTKVVSTTIGGRKALASSPDAIKTLIDERALPDIDGGKYTIKEAEAKLDEQIHHIDTTELQTALDKANVPETSSRVPLSRYRESALADATDNLIPHSGVNTMFDLLEKKYGNYPTLSQMNEAKRIVAKRISDAAFGSPEASANKLVRSALQQSIEDGANALGLGDIQSINQKMARLIKAQNLLKYINNKSVKNGLLGQIVQEGAAAGGEALGSTIGVPLVGAYATYKTGGALGKKLSGISKGILDRTGKDATRQTLQDATSKSKGLLKGAFAQKSVSGH